MKSTSGIFLLILAIGSAALVHRNLRPAAESNSWPAVEGTLVSTENPDPGQNNLAYAYRVGNVEYRGATIRLGNPLGIGDATLSPSKYPAGTKVQVHYNPSDPAAAILEPGVPGIYWALYAGPVVLAAIGVQRLLAGKSAG